MNINKIQLSKTGCCRPFNSILKCVFPVHLIGKYTHFMCGIWVSYMKQDLRIITGTWDKPCFFVWNFQVLILIYMLCFVDFFRRFWIVSLFSIYAFEYSFDRCCLPLIFFNTFCVCYCIRRILNNWPSNYILLIQKIYTKHFVKLSHLQH